MFLLDTNIWLERLLGQEQSQYLAAEWEQATIVSFDRDFDKTPRGRLTPAQLLTR